MTSNKYKLVPHHHSGRNPTFSSSLNHERSIPVVPNKAIGRLDLLPAALKSCASGNSSICSTCSMVKQAAPFLSKEMLTLTMIQQENSSSTSRSDIFTLGVHKNAVRLVRVNNDGKIEHGNGIGIKNGDVLSILLPVRNRIPLRIHYTFQIEGRESKEVEQVSSIQENSPQTSINTPKQTKMQQQLEGESSSSSPSPLRLARQNENSLSEVGSSSFEESPALTMPQNFGQDGGYSFESSAGSDLLTLQESRSNLSQRATRRLEYGSTSTCTGEQDNRHGRGRGRVLLSSLTIAELQEARDKCGNDDKGKLRRNFLDLVLVSGGGDQLPHLLKTRI